MPRVALLSLVLLLVLMAAIGPEMLSTAHRAQAELGRGDVNADGRVNSIDALLILQFEAGTIVPPPHPPEYYKKADVNQSGWVDSVDALLILQIDARLLCIPDPLGMPTVC